MSRMELTQAAQFYLSPVKLEYQDLAQLHHMRVNLTWQKMMQSAHIVQEY